MQQLNFARCICIHHCVLSQLIFLSSQSIPSYYAHALASEIIDNDGGNIILLKQPLSQHYFNHEIDFLAHQSMILGNYHGTADNKSSSIIDDKIHRLNFLAKSLRMELDYMRRLTKMMNNPNESMSSRADGSLECSESCSDETTESCSTRNKTHDTHERTITNAISKATWPSWVESLPSEINTTQPIEEERRDVIDYEWATANGFVSMYIKLNCHDHAYDQKKPIYTPEMWRKLWETFRTSTLFPFPIPDSGECPDEPYYVAHSVGKGRGNFASRNITKGSLVHSGHPNTVFFLDAKSWFRFVIALPKCMACDVMEWAWQQDLTNSGNAVMCLNMDKSVFFNDGVRDNNMEMKEVTSLDFYMTRDVEVGEELLYDYGHFEFDTNEMNL